MSYRLWGYVDEGQFGVITRTRVDSKQLDWPWVLIPPELNTHSYRAWRYNTGEKTWERRYLVVLSLSIERVHIDSEEYVDVMIVVPDEDDFQIVKQWTDLRLWIDDTLYEVAPGEIIRVSAHMPKRISVRLDDPRVYAERQERSILAVEPVEPLESSEEVSDGGTA